MTAPELPSPIPVPAAEPADLLLPQVLRRPVPRRRLGEPDSSRAAASITLSRELDAVLTRGSHLQTPADLGRAGLSVQAAWDESAANLMALATVGQCVRFWLRPAPDSGTGARSGWFEVAVGGAAAPRWLAHPRPFTLLDAHLTRQLGARPHYRWGSETDRTLFVTPQPSAVAADGPEFSGAVVYSAGFPIPAELADTAMPVGGTVPLLVAS